MAKEAFHEVTDAHAVCPTAPSLRISLGKKLNVCKKVSVLVYGDTDNVI